MGKPLALTLLNLNDVNFECFSGTAISLDERDFSLIEFEGYSFNIKLERIIIIIQNIGYFQLFLKILGIFYEVEMANRFINVKNLDFIGGESLTFGRNSLKNLNVSFESSSFSNFKAFEFNVLY